MAQQTKVDTYYTVAYQAVHNGPIHIYRIKESNRMELFAFIKRVLQIDSLASAAFIEVHEELPDGKGVRVVYGNPQAIWPSTVPVVRHEAVMGRKPTLEYDQPKPLKEDTTKRPADPEPQAVGLVTSELRDKEIAWLRPMNIKVA